jgi:thiol-disulfide isomerase/thioredoxin
MRRLLLLALLLIMTASAAAEIAGHPEQVRPLLPGQQVPAFELKSVSGQTVAVDPADFDRPLVLTFYRGGWCPYCNLHLAELRHAEAQLREMGFDVWFVSPDRPELLAEGKTPPRAIHCIRMPMRSPPGLSVSPFGSMTTRMRSTRASVSTSLKEPAPNTVRCRWLQPF